MDNDQLLKLLIEKLEKLEAGQIDIRERVTRVEGKFDTFEARQEGHYQQNQSEHNQLVSLYENDRKELTSKIRSNTSAIAAIKKVIERIKKGQCKGKSQLDERKGERRVLAKGWQLFIAFIAGGGIAGCAWVISKIFKIQ